jgi:hypothetical protein
MVVPPPLTLVAGHELQLKIAVIHMSLRIIAKLTFESGLAWPEIEPSRVRRKNSNPSKMR